jgi:hypothetical protein
MTAVPTALLDKYPDQIFIKVISMDSSIKITNPKCRMYYDNTFGQFMNAIRSNRSFNIDPNQMIYGLVGNRMHPTTKTMGQLADRYAEHGFLTVMIGVESTFG